MLTALETGVRGGRWHTLIDKVFAPLNLKAASQRVVAHGGAAGVDHQSVEHFLAQEPEELRRLGESLRGRRIHWITWWRMPASRWCVTRTIL